VPKWALENWEEPTKSDDSKVQNLMTSTCVDVL